MKISGPCVGFAASKLCNGVALRSGVNPMGTLPPKSHPRSTNNNPTTTMQAIPLPQKGFFGKLWDGVAVMLTLGVGLLVLALSSPVMGVRWVYNRLGRMRKTLLSLWLVVGGLFAFLYVNFVELSEFAAKPLTGLIGCSIFYVVVRFGHNEIDIINELKGGNHAVALYFLAYAAIIALSLLAF